ncbi:MAG: M55 family metallopeptidase [Streptosporangiales bacterium]|nr:M55 family metallopeptidase [Streptosporangiales bacterium]MBO0892041.1 M55 family metallopeptidase [Acidothermales bacterium]
MKVFLSFDMEGVAGVVDWSQCRPSGGAAYELGCALTLAEVNAAIDGAVGGGADEIVVNDAHGAMANLDPRLLHAPATYLSGRHKPGYMMQGLDASFDAVFFVGYHGSISGEPSTLSHTYNPEFVSGVRLGDRYVGESGINALAAWELGVPVALVTGDAVTLEELKPIAPDCVGVVTKRSVSRFAAHHLRPETACALIEDAARRAVEAVAAGGIAPPRIDHPATLEVELQTADMAEVAGWVKGVERSGTRRVRIEGGSGSEVYRAFVALTYITRQAGGR